MGYLIRNALALRNGKMEKCSLLIRKDKIKSFSFYRVKARSDDIVIDADGLFMMPGVIDPHVHFREPGLEHKETLESGSIAAAAGGVTTVFDMPNTIPPTFTVAEIERKRKLARKMIINRAFYIGASADNSTEIRNAKGVPGTKVYMNNTTGKLKLENDQALIKAFRASKLVAVHAEGRQVEHAIKLAKQTKKKLYCCHISLSKELSLIAGAKRKGQKVYCEVAPHHLFLSHTDDKDGFTKMKPHLRSSEDVASLWRGISTGIVDTIGTDHAPHTKQEKRSLTPPYGVPGVETSLPLMLTAARDKKLSYQRVVELMCTNPAKIFRIRGRGRLKKAFYADITLVDLETERKVKGDKLFTKCKWSPYEGQSLIGWPKYTFVNGQLAFENGTIHKTNSQEVRFR